uniref:ubiquitinyl hydrolase 1 n=1 Tax=Volvox carteri f. nagariensis TaxID=3068 RepID=D9CJ44_VOLCA|nr:MTM0046 [Volvox carteri f. nagariensis]
MTGSLRIMSLPPASARKIAAAPTIQCLQFRNAPACNVALSYQYPKLAETASLPLTAARTILLFPTTTRPFPTYPPGSSRECQRQHWRRHKPQCARLQQAERDRAARGLPRPPPPPPDPPLQLPTGQVSRHGYRALLLAHRLGKQAAKAASQAATAHPTLSAGPAPLDGYWEADQRAEEQRARHLQHPKGSEVNCKGGQLVGSEAHISRGRQGQPPQQQQAEEGQGGQRSGRQSPCTGSSPPAVSPPPSSVSVSLGAPASSSSSSSSAAASSTSLPAAESSTSPLPSSSANSSSEGPLLPGPQQQDRDRDRHHQQHLVKKEEGEGEEGDFEDLRNEWPWSWPVPPSPALLTPPRPAGILNSGNSCYAASAVQALLATPGLGEYLRSGAHCGGCVAPRQGEAPGGLSRWCPACELSHIAATAAARVAGEASTTPVTAPGGPAAAAAGAGAASAPGGPHTGATGAAASTAGRGVWSWSWSRPRNQAAAQAVDARELTRHVFRLGRTLVPGRQEDAHELLTKLLEALAEVQVAEAGGRGLIRGRAARRAAAEMKRRQQREAAAATTTGASGVGSSPLPPPPPPPVWRGEETSLVHQVLGGYLRRATLCDCCGHVSQSHESFLGLEVDLGRGVGSVEAGLQGYFAEEVLDAGNEYRRVAAAGLGGCLCVGVLVWRCERCRELVCATRRVRLEVAPNALAITLKRFAAPEEGVRGPGAGGSGAAGAPGGRLAKDVRPVGAWLGDLRDSLGSTASSYAGGGGGGSEYGGAVPSPCLVSMSMHMGHYVAVVRGGDGGWYRCDDDEITQVSESAVEAITDAYLLFYERIHPHVPNGGQHLLNLSQPQLQQQQQQQPELPQQQSSLPPFPPHAAPAAVTADREATEEWHRTGAPLGGEGQKDEEGISRGLGWGGVVEARSEGAGVAARKDDRTRREDRTLSRSAVTAPPRPSGSRELRPPSMFSTEGQHPHQHQLPGVLAAELGEELGSRTGRSGLYPPHLTSPCWSAWLQPEGYEVLQEQPPQAVMAGTVHVAVGTTTDDVVVVPGVPPAAAAAAAGVVRPKYQLIPPVKRLRGSAPLLTYPPPTGTEQEQIWTLKIWLPGVRSHREVRWAATTPPLNSSSSNAVLPEIQAAAATAAAAAAVKCSSQYSSGDALASARWTSAGRVRVWVVGSYSLDVQLMVVWKSGMAGEVRAVGGQIGLDGAGTWQLAVAGQDVAAQEVDGMWRTATGGRMEEQPREVADPVVGVGGCADGAATDVEVEVEVLQPRWRSGSSSLHVPLRLLQSGRSHRMSCRR